MGDRRYKKHLEKGSHLPKGEDGLPAPVRELSAAQAGVRRIVIEHFGGNMTAAAEVTGRGRAALTKWIRGMTSPPFDALEKLAEATGLDLAQVLAAADDAFFVHGRWLTEDDADYEYVDRVTRLPETDSD